MAYGDGRIFRSPGSKVWKMAFYVEGRKRVESTRETDEVKARKVLRLRVAEVLQGIQLPATGKALTLGDLLVLVRRHYEREQFRSLKTLPYWVRHLSDHFGDTTPVKAITSDRVDAYIGARRDEGAADSTIRTEVHLLDLGFKLAVEKRSLPIGARPVIKNINVGKRNARKGFVEREQFDRLYSKLASLPFDNRWCKTRDDAVAVADFFAFLFFSAWRIGEVRSLTWADFDRGEWGFRLRPENDKAGRGRVIPVEGDLRPIVERRLAARRLGCVHVFHMSGHPIGNTRKRWSRACKAAGLPGLVPHDLRRSGARLMRLAGVDQKTIMDAMGHTTASMFERYNIVDVSDIREAQLRAARAGR